MNSKPFLIDNLELLRKNILNFQNINERKDKRAQLWRLIKNSSRTAPENFPWFTPFVALITQEKEDVENAKSILFQYIRKLENMSFSSGLQYHFWCFSFPHAKWCMYFQWLTTINAFTKEEEIHIKEKLISYHFTNFFYGMRTKPEPECIDNQTLSLCLSNVIVGSIFGLEKNPSYMAKIMLEEALRRLPGIVGRMPSSGYSGEGSSYMDCVNGPAMPLVCEVLELLTKEKDVIFKEFMPNKVTPLKVLEIEAREWMPGGLLLPWDNYGYQYGVRAPIAYAARKTGEPLYLDILRNHAIWSYDIGVGWAYDDLVWTLLWWPANENFEKPDSNWADAEVGGILTAKDGDFYLMQIWDESEPIVPTRSHVNPNSVLFNAYGIPLSIDGSISKNCPRFQFNDTWREVVHTIGEVKRYNFGDGCAGAHSVLLVDKWEGLRAFENYHQVKSVAIDLENKNVCADVTPLYKEHFNDAVAVKRKSTVIADRFFLIEDIAKFEKDHIFTSRFILRPSVTQSDMGIKIITQEGVTLNLIDVIGTTIINNEIINGNIHYYPMDNKMLIVDFEGNSQHRLFVAFMSRVFKPTKKIIDWKVIFDEKENMTYEKAKIQLVNSKYIVPFELPGYMELPLPAVRKWWYKNTIVKEAGDMWLMLPRAMHNAKLWINDEEVNIEHIKSLLLAPTIKLPDKFTERNQIEVIISCEVPVSHFEGEGDGTMGLNNGFSVCYPCEEEKITDICYEGSNLKVKTNFCEYTADYHLMEE